VNDRDIVTGNSGYGHHGARMWHARTSVNPAHCGFAMQLNPQHRSVRWPAAFPHTVRSLAMPAPRIALNVGAGNPASAGMSG